MADTLIDDQPETGPGGPGEPGADLDDVVIDPPPGRAQRVGRLWSRFIGMPIEGWVSLFVVGFCVGFVFVQLGPGNVLANNTPAGGDMGAHVWGPAFLRDHLLPSGRLSGWTPDWYAGFPAYTFYMVIPSLAIALLSYLIPYGIAFKLVAVAGVLSLPVAAWAFGRLSRLPFPGPPMLAVAVTAFLFDRSFSIYGGNIASTLAGEFAFSLSLTFAVLYLGVLARGLETGRYRAWAAVLLALTALCHLIPLFFALAGTVVWVALQCDWRRVRLWIWGSLSAGSLALAYLFGNTLLPEGVAEWRVFNPVPSSAFGVSLPSHILRSSLYIPTLVLFLAMVGVTALVLVVAELARTRSRWWFSAPVLAVGGLLSAFWVVPFYLRHGYMNDMGWEKKLDYANLLFQRSNLDAQLSNRPGIEYLLAMAALGALLSLIYRNRAGLFWLALAVISALAFLYMPQGRLWNARLLPFYYLSLYLLGAVGLALLARALAQLVVADLRRPSRAVLWTGLAVMWGTWMVVLGLPLHTLPFGGFAADGSTWRWGPFSTTDSSFVTGWASWNFTGYEGKPAYPEYYAITQTMKRLGQDRGCGRAMWEHEPQHDRYGTPMALMLLPFWTDGCIGSMEGLYFEASATTPYHFLNQDELSTTPSNAQRGLPYVPGAPTRYEFDLGIRHLQMLGVSYYMAISAGMVDLGRTNANLTEVASSGPWVVFQVADSQLVTPLKAEPAVVAGASGAGATWLSDTVKWYLDPSQWDVPLAASGPPKWQRIRPGDAAVTKPVGTTSVSAIKTTTDSISFDVTQTGVPVVVKVSYFPNWKATGATGPYRISPNLMVVIPTSKHVSLDYGRTGVDMFAWALTALGLLGLVWLARAAAVSTPAPHEVWRPVDEPSSDDPPADPRDPAWWEDPDDLPEPDPGADPAPVRHGEPRRPRDAAAFDPGAAILGPAVDVVDAVDEQGTGPPPEGDQPGRAPS